MYVNSAIASLHPSPKPPASVVWRHLPVPPPVIQLVMPCVLLWVMISFSRAPSSAGYEPNPIYPSGGVAKLALSVSPESWMDGMTRSFPKPPLLEQQVPPAQYLDICASLHWWLLMPLSTYALGRHVCTCYSVSRPHDIILWLSIVFSTIISSWFLDYAIPYFLFLLYLVMFVSCPSDVVPHPSATSEVSYFIYNDTLSYIILTMYM